MVTFKQMSKLGAEGTPSLRTLQFVALFRKLLTTPTLDYIEFFSR